MPVTLTPYLHFRGNTREAMEFYHSIFGGKLNVQTFKDAHASQDPSDDDLVMHAQLDGDNGLVLMASDPPARMEDDPGANCSLSLTGTDEAALRGYFEKLAEGGTIPSRWRRPCGATPSACAPTSLASSGSSISRQRQQTHRSDAPPIGQIVTTYERSFVGASWSAGEAASWSQAPSRISVRAPES